MDPERRKQLKKEAEERTEDDDHILHIVYIHLTDAYTQLLIASAECGDTEDPRAEVIRDALKDILKSLADISEESIKGIPGVMTPEELEEEMKNAEMHSFVDWALRPTATQDDEDEDEGEQSSFDF